MTFREELELQRWDDHRYYHHSRINQSLHFLSAISFLAAYVFIFIDPVKAAILGWVVAMMSRQSGHFFFEPKGYDEVNNATHAHKEAIKVGFNLRRKAILHAIWAFIPALLYIEPSLFGFFTPHSTADEFARNVAVAWIALGVAALIGRTVQLFYTMNVQTGLVWCTKILTDPFHDVKLYHSAPLVVLKDMHRALTR